MSVCVCVSVCVHVHAACESCVCMSCDVHVVCALKEFYPILLGYCIYSIMYNKIVLERISTLLQSFDQKYAGEG